MAQAFALATGSTCAYAHGFAPVIQTSLKLPYKDCTSYSPDDLARETTSSLMEELSRRGGRPPQENFALALQGLVEAMVDMAEGAAPPSFFLSSLDPGVGKTTALCYFVRHLLASKRHKGVSVLLCFPRLDEIKRLVEEMGLDEVDFAVFTGKDNEINELSSTPPSEARILFTTHAMVKSRCSGCNFSDVEVFQYQGDVRTVRIWDEEMLPGEVVYINTDQLASLRDPLRRSCPALTELIDKLESDLKAAGDHGFVVWPDVEGATGTSLWTAGRFVSDKQSKHLEPL